VQTVSTIAGSLVDETDALAVAHGESLANTVFNFEGNMVYALAAIIEELLYGTLGACGLQEFQLHLANLEESGLHFLVFYNFCFVNFQTENVLEEGQYLVDALHSDAQMFNA